MEQKYKIWGGEYTRSEMIYKTFSFLGEIRKAEMPYRMIKFIADRVWDKPIEYIEIEAPAIVIFCEDVVSMYQVIEEAALLFKGLEKNRISYEDAICAIRCIWDETEPGSAAAYSAASSNPDRETEDALSELLNNPSFFTATQLS